MITIFAMPKAFHGHIAMIQKNAIQTWMNLEPKCEVILLGEDEGTAEYAAEKGLQHIPTIDRNEYGTPLLNDMFIKAEAAASHRVMCYINADIILMSDFMKAMKAIRKKRRFLLAGQRTDIDITEPLDFDSDWEAYLRNRAKKEGNLRPPPYIDYFAYSKGLWGEVPPFALGRTVWDNWLLYRARSLNSPLIDATRAVVAVHQNHDYAHAGGTKGVWGGNEARQNLALAGGKRHMYTLWDATHMVDESGLHPAPDNAGLGGGIWTYKRSSLYG